jgi:hypothetical protein
MRSAKLKTQVYLLVFSLVVSLVGMAVMKLSRSGPESRASKATTGAEALRGLEKVAPQSPAMAGFLQHEKARQETNQEVTGDLSN